MRVKPEKQLFPKKQSAMDCDEKLDSDVGNPLDDTVAWSVDWLVALYFLRYGRQAVGCYVTDVYVGFILQIRLLSVDECAVVELIFLEQLMFASQATVCSINIDRMENNVSTCDTLNNFNNSTVLPQ